MVMKKLVSLAALISIIMGCGGTPSSQEGIAPVEPPSAEKPWVKPRLAILPLVGGDSGDAETIAELFSFEKPISDTFVIVPRTSIINAINAEQKFQRDGLTNAENIQELGKRLNAEYVLSGSITAFAGRKLLIISIINIEHLQQIAGAYHEYQAIEEVDRFLADMASQVAAESRVDTGGFRELSVVPIASVSGQVNKADTEVLTQVLAIEIVRSGKFAVFPRTSSLDQVITEHAIQRTGDTDQGTTKQLGIGENPAYVLSMNVRNLGTKNMFTAAILNVEESTQGETGRGDYESIADGIALMVELAGKLTGIVPAAAAATATVRTATVAVPANMVLVPAGTFQMGGTMYDDEKPVHQVTISKPFYMGKYEVTQKEWVEVMGSNPSNWKGDNLPVEQVSWNDVIDYCNKRSVKEGLTPAYRNSGGTITCDWNANGYRLPTEAEWEWAAKGGGKDGLVYEYAGSNNAGTVAWYEGNSGGRTHDVGTKAPNSLGLYDMSGNVGEWCWDWYGGYSSANQTDPRGAASGSYRVLRGGSWGNLAQNLRSAIRGYYTPAGSFSSDGFRLARP
ncbi:hypothetical protein FACS1894200_09180 [Spirochaetia bacterium]|nr:hypothetical protein FACS1894200_09180 [Spirochaetia bacterium]